MAPAQIECMRKQPDGAFAWTPVRVVGRGASEALSTPQGKTLLTGTEHGYTLQQQDGIVEDVAARDTDEFELPSAVRRVATLDEELQIRAIEES